MLKPLRKALGSEISSVIPQEKLTQDSLKKARSELSKLASGGYETIAFERGQERISMMHGFRFRTFVVLQLQRPDFQEQSLFLRLQWHSLGLACQGPSTDDVELTGNTGVLYPFSRRRVEILEPWSALERLDVILASLERERRVHSSWDFNSGHFANAISAALLTLPSASSPSSREQALSSFSERPSCVKRLDSFLRIEPELAFLEPIDADGALLKVQAGISCAVQPPSAAILGCGAYGNVWRARDTRTLEEFAVKSVPAVDAERERQIFHHLRGWSHPCVVELRQFESVADMTLCVTVMQLCVGGNLHSQIQSARDEADTTGRQYQPPSAWKVWSGQIFLGLEHLHLQVRMLLLDLKPANVLLSAGGHVQLADFGASRLGTAPCRSWPSDVPPGTPGYTAPEVLRGEAHDCKADLFSFGALLWVLSTGGVTANVHAQPPSAGMTVQGDWAALFDDWRLLREHASSAEAALLSVDTRELVLGLSSRQPCQRLTHEGIRAHAFMQPLQMPAFEADCNDIQQWVCQPSEAVCEEPVAVCEEPESDALAWRILPASLSWW